MDFEVGGRKYRSSDMDPMIEINVLRKILPLMSSLKEFITPGGKINFADITIDQIGSILGPISKAIADLPDSTVHYVMAECLSIVRRDEGQDRGWAPIWNKQANRLQINIPALDIITIIGNVIMGLGVSSPLEDNKAA